MQLPYFNFFPKEQRADTSHLTFAQKGVYYDLLCLLWTKGKACRLPGDDQSIAALLAVSVREWRRYRPVLLEGQFALLSLDEAGWLYAPSLLGLYGKALGKSVQAREAAQARWGYAPSDGESSQGDSPEGDASASADAYAPADADGPAIAYAEEHPSVYADGHASRNANQNQIKTQSQIKSQIDINQESENPRARASGQDASSSEWTEVPKRYSVGEKHLQWAHKIGWQGNLLELQIVADDFIAKHRKKGTVSQDWHEEYRIWMRREVKMYPPTANRSGLMSGGAASVPQTEGPVEPKVFVVGQVRPNGGSSR